MGKNFKFFLKFIEGIKLHWLFHVSFGEINFSKWRDLCNQFKFLALAILKGFSEGFALDTILDTPTHLTQTVGRFDMWVTPRTITNRPSFFL